MRAPEFYGKILEEAQPHVIME